uniref:SET domain-containing protein n=1 Tax=Aureoumbra lagunensis TaxID=44058 RepID=A0A7S3NP89_9STRA|mmetsp:Transcript_3315/g.4605  ORF Transcript_3315/g.4605 Transcript_3315/m.4605 type:complete len:286 (+) Transcript_3315:29-886(+)
MTVPLPLINALLTKESSSIAIVSIAEKGRGVITTSFRKRGDVVLANMQPLAIAYRSHKTCLPWTLPPEILQYDQARIDLQKSQDARKEFEEKWPQILNRVQDNDRQYPILAAQIALRLTVEPAGNQSAYGFIIAALCAPKIEKPFPSAWMHDYNRLVDALNQERYTSSGHSAPSWLTPTWYAAIIGRLHLNLIQATDSSFSALYGFASFLNHNREPSLLVDFHHRAPNHDLIQDVPLLSLRAARDIHPNEELTISYISEHFHQDNQAKRDEYFLHNYGFVESSSC